MKCPSANKSTITRRAVFDPRSIIPIFSTASFTFLFTFRAKPVLRRVFRVILPASYPMKRKTRKIKIRQDSAKIIFVDILPQKTEFVYTLWKNFVDVGIFSFIFDIFSAVLLCNFVTEKTLFRSERRRNDERFLRFLFFAFRKRNQRERNKKKTEGLT